MSEFQEPFGFTPEQEAAHEKINQLAGANFDGAIIVLMRTNPDAAAMDHIKTSSVGGPVQVLGLAHIGLATIQSKFRPQ